MRLLAFTSLVLVLHALMPFAVTRGTSDEKKNLAPVIGVLGVPADFECGTLSFAGGRPGTASKSGSCFASVYVKWIESGGGQVIPIPHDASRSHLKHLYSQLNGFLFTGGGLNLTLNSKYVQTAKFMLDLAMTSKDDYFPVWGTCMGFQLLNIMTAWNESVLCTECFDSENIPLALELTPSASSSRMFTAVGPHIVDILSHQNVTMNFHHDGVTPQTQQSNPKLSSFYNVLSINHDRKGRPFVSTMEAKEWPIYGVQWHPERNQFEFNPQDDIPHFPDAIKAAQAMAEFFINEARKSKHYFTDSNDLQKHLIYNYCPVNYLYNSLLLIQGLTLPQIRVMPDMLPDNSRLDFRRPQAKTIDH